MSEVIRLDEVVGRTETRLRRGVMVPRPWAVRLGMPHLSGSGLSETWLLKELGHRHWFMLADAFGMKIPQFRDARGAPVYAAFCALSITDGAFGVASESDELTVVSELAHVSRTQSTSRHRLSIDGRPTGMVEMLSTFVGRTSGGNHTVARVALDGQFGVGERPEPGGMAALAAAFRAERVATHLGFNLGPCDAIASFNFDPCPGQDFNGAGFLYFTSFIAFVDRAEWQFDRRCALAATTVRRDIFFRGNIDPGEAIRVVLYEWRRTAEGVSHRSRIERCTDGAVLAEVFSIRSAAGAGHRSA